MGCLDMIGRSMYGAKAFIYTDREPEIKALTSPATTSKLVKECKLALESV